MDILFNSKRVTTLMVLFIFSLISSFIAVSQSEQEFGLIGIREGYDSGFTLFSPEGSRNSYLVNECGYLVNSWSFSDLANREAYLMPDGRIIRAGKDNIEIKDWEDNLLWSYPSNMLEQHHDIEPLPNGNILIIAYDYYDREEILEQGINESFQNDSIRLDKIVEVQPIGTDDLEIVWTWKLFDHLVQDIYPNKMNFGSVKNSPRRININFNPVFNFSHINSIDYNLDLDQILLSSRDLSEIFIIDHSTSSMEAASSIGGDSGHGGDLLWRFGNPETQNNTDDQRSLFFQHDAKWIDSSYPFGNSISIFNNRYTDSTSSIVLIEPEILEGTYVLDGNSFSPSVPDIKTTGLVDGEPLQEEKKGGVMFLENGNMLICETRKGKISEVDLDWNTYWSYVVPNLDSTENNVSDLGVSIFRADRYKVDYLSKEILSKVLLQGLLEGTNEVSIACSQNDYKNDFEMLLSSKSLKLDVLKIINPSKDGKLQLLGSIEKIEWLKVFDTNGRIIKEYNALSSTLDLNVPVGIYFIVAKEFDQVKMARLLVK